MSNFLISSNPVLITQTGTQDSLIQNVGTSTVYLNSISSVTPDAYGFALAPRATVNYPTGQDLWAATASGETSELTVFYGATGAALSEVSAVITGDVTATIDGPVNATITGPVTVEGTVNVGNVVQTETNVTNTVSTNVENVVSTAVTNTVSTEVNNTVETTVTGTVDTLVTGPVAISGTVPVTGNVGITGPVTVSGSVGVSGNVGVTGPVTVNGSVGVSGPVTVSGTVNANVAGDVDATITGPVTIGGAVTVGGIETPVVIQGGGEILYNANVNTIAAGGSRTITINAPASGTTFYGIDVSWEILTSPAGVSASTVRAYVNGFPGTPVMGTAMRDTSAAEIAVIGFSERLDFTTPMRTTFPLTITIDNSNLGGTLSGFLRVTGTSYASPYPVDNMNGWMGVGSLGARVTPAANDYVTIQPSFSTLAVTLQPEAAGLDNVSLSQWNTLTDAYDIQLRRISHSPYYSQAGVAAQYDMLRVTMPPIGQPHRIFFHSAFAGQINITLSEVQR